MLSVFRLGQRVATTQITRFRVPVALMSHSFVATAGSSGLQRGNGTVEEQIRSKASPGPTWRHSIETQHQIYFIFEQLMAAFEPELLVITNDSWKHSSHAAMRELGGGNGETRTYLALYTLLLPSSQLTS